MTRSPHASVRAASTKHAQGACSVIERDCIVAAMRRGDEAFDALTSLPPKSLRDFPLRGRAPWGGPAALASLPPKSLRDFPPEGASALGRPGGAHGASCCVRAAQMQSLSVTPPASCVDQSTTTRL